MDTHTVIETIVEIMDNYINKGVRKNITLDKIQTLLEENYIHVSLDNDYK